MLQWAFRIGLAALVLLILLGGAIAIVDPNATTDQQAHALEVIGDYLVAVWIVAGIPLWVSSVAHLWRNRRVLSRARIVFWGFFLMTLSLFAAFVYFPRFVRARDTTN